MYEADISTTLISSIINAVVRQVIQWQVKHSNTAYPMVSLDYLVVKTRQTEMFYIQVNAAQTLDNLVCRLNSHVQCRQIFRWKLNL